MTINYQKPIYTQYQDRPTLNTLAESIAEAYSLDDLMSEVLAWCANVDTAYGAGLDILGDRVGVSRTQDVPAIWPETVAPGLIPLSDDQYRSLIKAKAAANIAKPCPADTNHILQQLVGSGNPHVKTTGVMAARVIVSSAIEAWLFPALTGYDILPRATGVEYDLQVAFPYFGFAEALSWQPFGPGGTGPFRGVPFLRLDGSWRLNGEYRLNGFKEN